jgi:hypothetical protein
MRQLERRAILHAKEVTAQNIMKREQPDDDRSARSRASIDLYWLPLGAGGHSVRLNGRIYEAVAARLGRRPVSDLYHSALEVRVPEGRFVIEQAPMRAGDGAERGVVAEGAVGSRWAGTSESSGTSCAAGATASSPMLPRPSKARSDSATTRSERVDC